MSKNETIEAPISFIEYMHELWGAIPKTGTFHKEKDPIKIAEIQLTLMQRLIKHYDTTRTMRAKMLDQAMQMVFGKNHKPNSITNCVDCIKRAVLQIRNELNNRTIKAAAAAQPAMATDAAAPTPPQEPQPPIHSRIVYCVWSSNGKAGIKPAKALQNMPNTNVRVQLLDPIGTVAVEWPRSAVHEVLQIALNAASALVGRDIVVGPIDPNAIEGETFEFVAPLSQEIEGEAEQGESIEVSNTMHASLSKLQKGVLLDNGETQVTVTRIAAGIVYYVRPDGSKDSVSQSEIGTTWMIVQ